MTQDGSTLTPGQAAAALGVRTALLAEWADAGLIRAARTGKGHRRYAAADVAAFTPPTRASRRALFVLETPDGAVRVRGNSAIGPASLAALTRTVLAAQRLLRTTNEEN